MTLKYERDKEMTVFSYVDDDEEEERKERMRSVREKGTS